MCHTFDGVLTWMRNDAFYRSVDSRLRGNDGGEDARNDGYGPLWIDESPITLAQRVRFQRGRTSFFIVLVPMNGPPTRE